MHRHGRRADRRDFSSLAGVEHVELLENTLQENGCISVMSVPQVMCLSRMLHMLSLAGPGLFFSAVGQFWVCPLSLGQPRGWILTGTVCTDKITLHIHVSVPCPSPGSFKAMMTSQCCPDWNSGWEEQSPKRMGCPKAQESGLGVMVNVLTAYLGNA